MNKQTNIIKLLKLLTNIFAFGSFAFIMGVCLMLLINLFI